MTRVGLVLMIGFCAAGAVAASAAETSISRTVTGAFSTVVIQATNAATAATKAADDAIQSAKKKKSKDAKAPKSKDADARASESASASGDADGKSEAGDTAAANGKAAAGGKQGADNKAADTTVAKDKDKPADGKPGDAAKAADGTAPDGKTGDPKANPVKPVELTEWPAADIEIAKARCTALLKTVDAVTMPEAPFRSGDCGAPAPVRLISLGKNPEVSLSPPALVTCDMVVALSKWVKGDLQPLARKHLGGSVIKIETMSDYSCRKAYGRIGNKLSEHGKANALDIRGFTTNKGQDATVLAGWGQTKRDLARQIAAAKAAAEKAEAVKTAAEHAEQAKIEAAGRSNGSKTAVGTGGHASVGTSADANIPRATIIDGVPGAGALRDAGFGLAPTRLGGPKDEKSKDKTSKKSKAEAKAADKEAIAKAADDVDVGVPAAPGMVVQPIPGPAGNPTMAFLHDAHDAACRIFGTTLGPEANDAHRNHFHVDMAERKVKKICD